MDNQIGKSLGATGMRIVELSSAVEIHEGDRTSPLEANVQPVLKPLRIRTVPRKRESGQDFAPSMQELKGVDDELKGTTVIPAVKIRS